MAALSSPRAPQPTLAHRVRSSLSVPLVVDEEVIGALNVHGYEVGQFSEQHRHRVEAFAERATSAIALLLRQASQARTLEELQRALTSRATIDQATGVIMAQQRCDADRAFAVLRSHSQNSNCKLRDVTAEVVGRVAR